MSYCNTSDPKYATTLAPGKFAQLNFNAVGAKGLDDPALTLTFELVVTPNSADPSVFEARSLGFFDLTPVMR